MFYYSGEGSRYSDNSDERAPSVMARAVTVHPDTVKFMYFAWEYPLCNDSNFLGSRAELCVAHSLWCLKSVNFPSLHEKWNYGGTVCIDSRQSCSPYLDRFLLERTVSYSIAKECKLFLIELIEMVTFFSIQKARFFLWSWYVLSM